jgi:hypothetical protein
MNIEVLADELANDPLAVGYSNMTAAEAAIALNTANRPTYQSISGAALLRWAAAGATAELPSRLVRIKLASELSAPFASIGYAAQGYAAASVAAISAQVPLSYDDAAVRDMVTALVAAGVLTSGESEELHTLGATTVSRATELGIGHVKAGHVEQTGAL